MFLFRVLLSTLLFASNIGLALKHGSLERYDILHGTRGESACTLKDVIDLECSASSTRRDFLLSRNDDTPLIPSKCTCNAIFFNIWSACFYSTGNNTLPNFAQWTQRCTKNSVNVDSSIRFSEVRGNLGIDVPSWARMKVPGNSTFDIQRAVTIACTSSRQWTTLQKMLPLVAVLATLLVSGAALLIYQQYHRKHSRGSSNLMEWPKGLKRLHLHTSHKVTTTFDRDEAWEIDGPVVKQPPFVKFSPSSDDGHGKPKEYAQESSRTYPPVPIRAFSFDDMEMTDVHEPDKNPKTISSLNSATEKAPMGTNSFRMPMRSRLPWKRKPPYIRLVPATPRFRVDDAKSIFTCSGEAGGRNEISVVQELVEDVDHVPPEIEETTSLITASERAERDSQDVILISKGNQSFSLESRSENTSSINSNIKIISPSVSSTSPHSVMCPVPAKPKLYIPIPPPPPSHAAPRPPVMPPSLRPTTRKSPSDSNWNQSIPYFQSPILSPIKEASSPLAAALSFSSSNNNLRRAPAIRRPSDPESVSSQQISPESSKTTSPSNFHRTASPGPDLSLALGSEEDFYMEDTTNGQYRRPPAADCNAPVASFYSNYPFQTPVQRYPGKLISLRSAGAAAFYPGPVRGAGYPVRTDSR